MSSMSTAQESCGALGKAPQGHIRLLRHRIGSAVGCGGDAPAGGTRQAARQVYLKGIHWMRMVMVAFFCASVSAGGQRGHSSRS
jgi:hypothetical protein